MCGLKYIPVRKKLQLIPTYGGTYSDYKVDYLSHKKINIISQILLFPIFTSKPTNIAQIKFLDYPIYAHW